MSSWKNAAKAGRKTHRERHQPESRQHLGLLEKKRDYKRRANNYNKRKRTLEILTKKALNKNPDEFYFHMINSVPKNDLSQDDDKEDEHTPEQLLLMNSQDLRYITMKRTMEIKKIENLQSHLHYLDVANKAKNRHIFFVDSKKETEDFDVAKRLNTHPNLVWRKTNRIQLNDLGRMELSKIVNKEKEYASQKLKMYNELAKRVNREKELRVVQQKLQVKKDVMASKVRFPEKVKQATKHKPSVYKWEQERKK